MVWKHDRAEGARDTGGGAVFTIVIIVLLLGIAVAVTYAWQHHEVANLRTQASQLTQQISTLKAQLQGKSATSQPNSTSVVNAYTSSKGVTVKLFFPQTNQKVASPLPVLGEIPGNWSSEASFPVKLVDSNGKVVAQGSAQVLGDWMTDQLVPFSAKLTWSATVTGKGSLVLVKDNPSALPEHDDTVSIPIVF